MKTGCFKQVDDGHVNGFISISLYPSQNEFVKYDQVMQYVERIDLYYKTLSMLYKDEELLLLAQK